jgi:hypothetical protein
MSNAISHSSRWSRSFSMPPVPALSTAVLPHAKNAAATGSGVAGV